MGLTQEEQKKKGFDSMSSVLFSLVNFLFPFYQQRHTDWVMGRAEKGIKELCVPNV